MLSGAHIYMPIVVFVHQTLSLCRLGRPDWLETVYGACCEAWRHSVNSSTKLGEEL